jgi:hypothetical protein
MGEFSWLARRPAAAGDLTHALFAAQSHSIVDNLVALFEHSRAWNCSNQEPALNDINRSLNGASPPRLYIETGPLLRSGRPYRISRSLRTIARVCAFAPPTRSARVKAAIRSAAVLAAVRQKLCHAIGQGNSITSSVAASSIGGTSSLWRSTVASQDQTR